MKYSSKQTNREVSDSQTKNILLLAYLPQVKDVKSPPGNLLVQQTCLWIEFFKQAFFSEKTHLNRKAWRSNASHHKRSLYLKPDSGRPLTKEFWWNQQRFLPFIYNQSNHHNLKWGDIEINPGNGNSHFQGQMIELVYPDTRGWMPISICIQLTTNFLPSFPLASLLLSLWYQSNPTDRLFPQRCLTSFLPFS